MVVKISPIEVIKDTFKLFWNKKLTYVGLTIAPLMAIVAMFGLNVVMMQASRSGVADFSAGLFLTMLAVFVGMWVYMLIFNHYVITHLRGAPRLIPENLGNKILRTFVFFLKFIGILLLAMIPFGLVFGLGFASVLDNPSVGAMIIFVLIAIPVSVLAYIVMMRIMMVVPGIAMGELHKIRDAWGMTKGNGFRLFLSFLLFLIPIIIAQAIAESVGDSLLILALMFVIQAVTQILTIIATGVWYEKLLPAYRDTTKNAAQPESTADEVADLI